MITTLAHPRESLRRLAGLAVVAVALATIFASSADADFRRSPYTYNTGGCNQKAADPVTGVLLSRDLNIGGADNLIRVATEWRYTSGGDQWIKTFGTCRHAGAQRAEQFTGTRYHTRLFQMASKDAKGRNAFYLTPHHEHLSKAGSCPKGVLPSGHAIDRANGTPGGFQTGKIELRRKLYRSLQIPVADVQQWHNMRPIRQCDGNFAANYTGTVVFYKY